MNTRTYQAHRAFLLWDCDRRYLDLSKPNQLAHLKGTQRKLAKLREIYQR